MLKTPAILNSIRTRKDRSLSITFETNELSNDHAKDLFSMHLQYGWLVFLPTENEPLPDLPKIDGKDSQQSESVRLRNKIFKLYRHKIEKGMLDRGFESFYELYMDHLRTSIDKLIV